MMEDYMDEACRMYGDMSICTNFWSVNMKRRDHLQTLGIDGKIRWTLRKLGRRVWTESI
jgi:hypothetical protein